MSLLEKFNLGEDTVFGVEPTSLHRFVLHYATVQAIRAALEAASALSQAEGAEDGNVRAEDWEKAVRTLLWARGEEDHFGSFEHAAQQEANVRRNIAATRPREQDGAYVPQAIQFDDPRRIEYVTRDCFSVYEQIDENFAVIRDGPDGAIIGASIARPREQEGAEAGHPETFDEHIKRLSKAPPAYVFQTPEAMMEFLDAPAHLPAASFQAGAEFSQSTSSVLAGYGYQLVPRWPDEKMLDAARKWASENFGQHFGNKVLTGCYQAMLADAPTPSAVIRDFQAGAEAMREAAAKVAESAQFQSYGPHDHPERIAAAIRELPLPASSEGR